MLLLLVEFKCMAYVGPIDNPNPGFFDNGYHMFDNPNPAIANNGHEHDTNNHLFNGNLKRGFFGHGHDGGHGYDHGFSGHLNGDHHDGHGNGHSFGHLNGDHHNGHADGHGFFGHLNEDMFGHGHGNGHVDGHDLGHGHGDPHVDDHGFGHNHNGSHLGHHGNNGLNLVPGNKLFNGTILKDNGNFNGFGFGNYGWPQNGHGFDNLRDTHFDLHHDDNHDLEHFDHPIKRKAINQVGACKVCHSHRNDFEDDQGDCCHSGHMSDAYLHYMARTKHMGRKECDSIFNNHVNHDIAAANHKFYNNWIIKPHY